MHQLSKSVKKQCNFHNLLSVFVFEQSILTYISPYTEKYWVVEFEEKKNSLINKGAQKWFF